MHEPLYTLKLKCDVTNDDRYKAHEWRLRILCHVHATVHDRSPHLTKYCPRRVRNTAQCRVLSAGNDNNHHHPIRGQETHPEIKRPSATIPLQTVKPDLPSDEPEVEPHVQPKTKTAIRQKNTNQHGSQTSRRLRDFERTARDKTT